MLEEFGEGNNIKDYANLTQIAQAEGIKWAVEHYRRRKYKCAGALIWQLSDLWPAITWSLIDYYLFPKISYFWTKKCFAPVLLSFFEEKEEISLWITSDLSEKLQEIVYVSYQNFKGEKLWSNNFKVNIKADESRKILDIENGILGYGKNKKDEFLYARININEKIISENYYFFSPLIEQEKIKANIIVSDYKIDLTSINIKIKTMNTN